MPNHRTYSQFCPVAKAAEVFAERWTPLVLRELLSGSRRFNELRRGIALISPSVLSQRLKDLEWAGLIERRNGKGDKVQEYHPTPACEELKPVIEQLGIWGHRWIQAEIKEGDLDASLLMWDIHRRINVDQLPSVRVVVRFWFPDAPQGLKQWWLMLDRDDIDVCNKDPGFEVDLVISTSLHVMTSIWQGDLEYREATGSGELQVQGPPDLVRQLPTWFKLSVFADVERQAPADSLALQS